MAYEKALEWIVEEFSGLEGVSKILHYGSSARGEPNPKDIDIAIILNDLMGMVPLDDLEGFPIDYQISVNCLREQFKTLYGVPLHLATYWTYEFQRGILLGSERMGVPEWLNEVGIVLYDAEKAKPRILSKT